MKKQPSSTTPLLDEWKSFYEDWPMGLTPYTRKYHVDMIISDEELVRRKQSRDAYDTVARRKRKAAYKLKVREKQSAYSLAVLTGVAEPGGRGMDPACLEAMGRSYH